MVELSSVQRTWIVGALIAINGAYFASRHNLKRGKTVADLLGFDVPEVVCFSPARLAVPLEQLFLSTGVIVLICALGHILRKSVDAYVRDSLIRLLLQEAIAAADLCGCCFELIIVADNYGVWMYGLYLLLLTMWWSADWGDANACPSTQIEEVVMGKQDSQLSLTKIWAQLTGGIFVFKFIQYIWSLELIENHEGRAVEDCAADLQVPMLHGFLIEGGGTLLCRLASKVIADLEPKYGTFIESFIGTGMVVAAFDRTGGYFNPALATALKFGCEGNTLQEHVVVYWAGTCLGSVLSVLVYDHMGLGSAMKKLAPKKPPPPPPSAPEPTSYGFWNESD